MRKIQLAKDTISKDDLQALSTWLLQDNTPQLTKGELTVEFEEKYAAKVGCKYAVLVNSGSSANLLMTYALVASNSLIRNQKIVIPALSWITSIAPAMQFGLKPILCDCNKDDLSVDINHLEKIFREQSPSAFLFVNVLGLMGDMDAIYDLCQKYCVKLIIDNCEGTGSKYNDKYVEQYGIMTSTSLYMGHIISSIEGGIITTDDDQFYNLLKMLRSHGWDRDVDNQTKDRLRLKYNVSGFNSLYTFYYPGFNVRSTEINAFLALRQLDKLDFFSKQRSHNFYLLNSKINQSILNISFAKRFVSNLGFPVVSVRRDEMVKKLQDNGVEVRPLISGSMGTQPFYAEQYGRHDLPNASFIDKHSCYVPNHPFLSYDEINFMADIIKEFTHQ